MAKTIFATAPDLETATSIITTLVNNHLVACGTIIPNVMSIYRWEGAVEHANEVQMVLKTDADVTLVQTAFTELHPYDVPEFIVVEITDGLPAYLDWVHKESTPPSS